MHLPNTEEKMEDKDIEAILEFLRKSTKITTFALLRCGLTSHLATFTKMTKVDQRKVLVDSLTPDMKSELMRAAVATKDMNVDATYEFIQKEYPESSTEKASRDAPFEAKPVPYEAGPSKPSTAVKTSGNTTQVGSMRILRFDSEEDERRHYEIQAKKIKEEKKVIKAARREQERLEQEEIDRIEEIARQKRKEEKRERDQAERVRLEWEETQRLRAAEHAAQLERIAKDNAEAKARRVQEAEAARIKEEKEEAQRAALILDILPVLTYIYKKYPSGSTGASEEQGFILAGCLGLLPRIVQFEKNLLSEMTRNLFSAPINKLKAFQLAIGSIKATMP